MCSLFDQMSESDQKEYLELHNNFFVPGSTPTEIGKVILDFCLAPDMDTVLDSPQAGLGCIIMEDSVSENSMFSMADENLENTQKIMQIVCIYLTNFDLKGSEVMIKTSRFNQSCRPNATLKSNGNQIWTISDIQSGKDILRYGPNTTQNLFF